MEREIYYKLKDGKVWSVNEHRFISERELPEPRESEEFEVITLISAEGRSDVAYLRETLLAIGAPLGDIATPEDLLDEIIEGNKEYLLKMLMMSVLDIEIPDKALAHFNELKKELKAFPSEAIAKFVLEK